MAAKLLYCTACGEGYAISGAVPVRCPNPECNCFVVWTPVPRMSDRGPVLKLSENDRRFLKRLNIQPES